MTETIKIKKLFNESFFSDLLRSHMIISIIGALSLLFGLGTIIFQAGSVNRLSNSSIPLARTSSAVLSGIQQSLASTRGWVSLGDEIFLADWNRVWRDQIPDSLLKMKQQPLVVTSRNRQEQVNELALLLTELKESQWWVLEVAQTLGNEPGKVKYQFEVEPIYDAIGSLLKQIRTDLLWAYDGSDTTLTHDFYEAEISFYASKEILSRIVFQGEIGFANQYRIKMQEIRELIPLLANPFSVSYRVLSLLPSLEKELSILEELGDELIEIRGALNWNIARHLIETETFPIAKRVVKVMDSLITDSEKEMRSLATVTAGRSNIAVVAISILLVTMLLAAIVLSHKSASHFSEPVQYLASAARQLAAGDLTEDITPVSDNELGELTVSFNTMRQELEATQGKAVRQEKLAAIGKLSGSVAHDIRNPLGAISNSIYYLNAVATETIDEKCKKHLKLMKTEILKISIIMSDLTDFSRENTPNLSNGNINLFLDNIVSTYDLTEGVKIDWGLDKNMPNTTFDHSQLQRVFNNLITNSLQSMEKGGTLKIKTSQDKEAIRVDIGDTGHGIAKEELDLIFEPLFTTKAKGVGLGLVIVKDFVEKHGGYITVESELGRGATFSVRLPINNSAEVGA